MKHACKDCKHGEEFWGCRECMHDSCFLPNWNPWHGVIRERITDYETKNRDGACPDYEEKG